MILQSYNVNIKHWQVNEQVKIWKWKLQKENVREVKALK